MIPVLIDDWLYIDIDGQVGTYGREETQRNLKSKMSSVAVAFIDCETKIISTPQESGVQKEILIDSAFNAEYLIQEERLSINTFQIIGAKKEKIEEIYQYFKPVVIKTLVPYAVSIRAFLKSKSIPSDDRVIIFVDDLKTQAIVTIIDGLRFSAPRRISMRDLGYMTSEIRRSRQSYLASKNAGLQTEINEQCMVVSNNKEWLTFFSGEGLVNREDILHIDSNFPVLEGLKTAKFGIHFLLPQELVRQKKREILNSFLKTLVVSFLSVGVGLGIFIYSLSYKNKIQDQIKVLKIQEQVNTAKLIELYQSRLLDLLSQNKHLAFDHLYFNFVKHIPANYILKNFDIIYKDNGLWSFEASIYPEDEYVAHQMFQQQGVFKQSNVVPIFLNNKLGQRITRDIDLKKEQI